VTRKAYNVLVHIDKTRKACVEQCFNTHENNCYPMRIKGDILANHEVGPFTFYTYISWYSKHQHIHINISKTTKMTLDLF